MNSRERRAQAYRAKCAAENALGRKIEATLSGCSINVLTAVTAAPNWRVKPEESTAICLPDVAIYNAGHRKPTKSIYPAR